MLSRFVLMSTVLMLAGPDAIQADELFSDGRESSIPAFPDSALAKRVEAAVRSDLAFLDKDPSYNACQTQLPRPGECKDAEKKAVVFYDPVFARHESKSSPSHVSVELSSPGTDCLSYQHEMNKKGYCVEAWPITDNRSFNDLRDFLYRNELISAQDASDYNFERGLVLLHGEPGGIMAPYTQCALSAYQICAEEQSLALQTGEPFSDQMLHSCIRQKQATKELAQTCPCHAEQARLMAIEDMPAEESRIPDIRYAARLRSELAACMESEENKEFYSGEIAPSEFTSWLKAEKDGTHPQLMTMSCATGRDQAHKDYAASFCSNAPQGMIFNLSLTHNCATGFCPPESFRGYLNQCLQSNVTADTENHEIQELIEYVQGIKEPVITKWPSSLVCFQCLGEGRIQKMDDCQDLDNALTIDMEYELLPERTKHYEAEQDQHRKAREPRVRSSTMGI